MLYLTIPTIETERLRLRPPRPEDIGSYQSIVCSERGQYIGGPLSEEDAYLDFSQMVAGWILRGYGALSIEDKETSQFYGVVLIHLEFDDPETELGLLLNQAGEGKGIALEASLAMLDWAWEETHLRSLVSYVDPKNARGIRLLERIGASYDGDYHEVQVWRHSRK